MCSVLWYCPCGNRPLQDGGKGTDRGRQGLTRPLGGGVEEGLHRADATVGIRVRTGQIGAIPGGQATCASAIALQKSSRAPFSCSAAEQQRSEQEKGEKKKRKTREKVDEVATRFGPGEERMRFERAAKQQAVAVLFVPLCFSGHCRQDTAQDNVEGPVLLCVLGAWPCLGCCGTREGPRPGNISGLMTCHPP